MSEKRRSDLAWAAGLFEGEGCISIQSRDRKTVSKQVALEVYSSDKDVLDRFQHVVGCGRVTSKKVKDARHKPMFRWIVTGKVNCEWVLESLGCNFGERRKLRALEALATLAFTKTYRPRVAPV